jgi:hypothetical protein
MLEDHFARFVIYGTLRDGSHFDRFIGRQSINGPAVNNRIA